MSLILFFGRDVAGVAVFKSSLSLPLPPSLYSKIVMVLCDIMVTQCACRSQHRLVVGIIIFSEGVSANSSPFVIIFMKSLHLEKLFEYVLSVFSVLGVTAMLLNMI